LEYEIMSDGATEKEVKITIPLSELDQFIDTEVQKIRKDLTLKGFRKGKVPANLIRTRYIDTLKAQAVNSLVNDSFQKLLDEKKWRAVSQADMLNYEENENIQFNLKFEIAPEFDIENYMGIEVFQPDPLPDEFLLEQALNELKERYSTIQEVMRPAAVDDYVTLDMEISEKDDKKNRRSNVRIHVGDRAWPDEINRALVGTKRDDEKDVTIDKKLHKLYVKKIEEKVLPLIDNDFAVSKGLKDLEELKQKLLEETKKIEEKRVEDELKESVSNVLLERTQFKTPSVLINNEYQRMLQRVNLEDSDSNKERFWNIAERRARLNLIIDKIAVKENISVDDKDAMNFITATGLKVDKEDKADMLLYIKTLIMRDKTIDFLYKKANISKKSRIVSPKEVKNDTSTVRH
jgi:trigger factor